MGCLRNKNNIFNNNNMDSSSDNYELHSASDHKKNAVKGVRRLASRSTYKTNRSKPKHTADDDSSESDKEVIKKKKSAVDTPDDLDEISSDFESDDEKPSNEEAADEIETPEDLDEISSEIPKFVNVNNKPIKKPNTLDDISSDEDMEMKKGEPDMTERPINKIGQALGVTKKDLKNMAVTAKPGPPTYNGQIEAGMPMGMPGMSMGMPNGMPMGMSPDMPMNFPGMGMSSSLPTYMPPELASQGMMPMNGLSFNGMAMPTAPMGMPPGMMPGMMPGIPGMPSGVPPEMQGMAGMMPGMMPQGMPGMMPQGMPGMMPQGMQGMPQMMGGSVPNNFFFNT